MIPYLIIGILAGASIAGIVALIRFGTLTRSVREKENTLARLEAERDLQTRELEQVRIQLNDKEVQWLDALRDNASKDQLILQLQKTTEEKEKDLQVTLEKLESRFRLLANELLDDKSKKLSDQNSEKLREILSPLREQLSGFEKRVESTYQNSLRDQKDLQAELKKLHDLNQRISEEAGNLTRALKGDVKKIGNWGEMILERILERSGLVRGEEYQLQVSVQNEEGRRFQPDVVVYLPDEKHLLIDSKVSLIAYERLINSEEDDKRTVFLREHIAALRKHIRELSEKNYSAAKGLQSPEFVLMFVPIEASFSLAVKEDLELFNDAWDRRIVIVSPTTLLATLMTISSLWKQAKQSKHAQLIADQGARLFDKIKGFLDDFEKIGDRLEQAQKSYEDAHKKLRTGRGNLIKKAEDMKKLGLQTSQQLPDSFGDYEDLDDQDS